MGGTDLRATGGSEADERARVLQRQGESYHDIPPEFGPFDLAVVDGKHRWRCIEAVLPRMRANGIVYLDNADSDKDLRAYPDASMSRVAQAVMEDFARSNPGARLNRIKSLVHGEFFAGEGWLLRVPGNAVGDHEQPLDAGRSA